MYCESGTENVAHDDDVSLRVVDCDSVHPEVLRQQCVRVPLNYILQHHTTNAHRIGLLKLMSIPQLIVDYF